MDTLEDILNNLVFLGDFSFDGQRSSAKEYAILPSIVKPRWCIPLNNKKVAVSSFALYQPSLLRAKLVKQLTICLARLGLIGLLKRERVYFERNDEEINKIFAEGDLYYSVFTGTEGRHRKVTVQVTNEKGVILGYIKVSNNSDIDRLLKNEAETLSYISHYDIKSGLVPKVLYHGNINDLNILIINTVKNSESSFSSMLSNAHIAFLAEIFRMTSKVKKFNESEFAVKLKERILRLKDTMSVEWSHRSNRVLKYLDESIGDRTLSFGLCHRDFTPWNTFFHDGKLYVFDWEYAGREYPPLLDVCHFIIQDGILVRKLNQSQLIKRIKKEHRLIINYFNAVSVDSELASPLLICYLLDISLLYIEREKGEKLSERFKTYETWGALMDLVIQENIKL